ncbi:hypothetical protein JQ557_15880 [Bradyrhizobium sp. U87765 SZCCT0131]|uniref:hypothetical protein n=1 Tax=unclassified Bradyrhizobium TaxID=2631580 RepID=UPI001BA95BE3|nr:MULTISPECIES: hypothetical protein [unclassified Bradyrhizobium]MBR1219484.1 hypothetical protein [Bradyrhizobium sp. U87765 SZCCT0131]MBR1262135.1 hypothetical protein [Bradyrhizobium sp. U87765 SZCCT0134]MBR1308682.1 hypothetical protein [Bradyrhizobium sp. U87765 SZCCT0110]MBR1317917.1 hypothetical protein [Bradyrhizobium sp. U87765 SZCCT0109]MBR1351620.1 hypothetical protein [Bradyrhizobium sp. U87765 SZCCT0048]
MVRTLVRLGVVIAIAAIAFGGWWLVHRPQAVALMQRPVSAAILKDTTRDTFFAMIAAYCHKHPSATDTASCAICSPETCPDCGFGPERSALVSDCNPSSWDCAASFVFAPFTGGSCQFGTTSGTCRCPQSAPLQRGAGTLQRFAALPPPAAAGPFSPRVMP